MHQPHARSLMTLGDLARRTGMPRKCPRYGALTSVEGARCGFDGSDC